MRNLFLMFLMLSGTSLTAQGNVTFFTDDVAFNNASIISTVEDFEAFSPKDIALSSFTFNGIIYSGITNVWVSSPGYTNFGVPITDSSILTATGDEDITVSFEVPVTAVGFNTYLNSFGPAVVEVIGSNGILDVFSPSHNPTEVGFLGITSSEEILSIHWKTVNGAATNTGIDNILTGSIRESLLVSLNSFTALSIPGNNGEKVLLKWDADSEFGNVGFRVWRAVDSGNGNYKDISTLKSTYSNELVAVPITNGLSKLIPTKGEREKKSSYSYVNTAEGKNKTFYYLLEDVDFDGQSTFHCDKIQAVTVGKGYAIDLKIAKRFCESWCSN
jgi:hypothetical protein